MNRIEFDKRYNSDNKISSNEVMKLIMDADKILIGAGSGLSTAAGLYYEGKRFSDNFQEFITMYGKENMTNMYHAAFYPFKTSMKKWGYMSKHVMMNRINTEALDLYLQLFQLLKDKDYFVITTNVDHQFYKSGFDPDKIFAMQGDYANIQCSKACHDKLYDATNLIIKMDEQRQSCEVPQDLIPYCPVCGEEMDLNLRKDSYFVEDELWHKQSKRYVDYVSSLTSGKVLLLEFGVGFNTPSIIRYPFESLTKNAQNVKLLRFNKDYAFVPREIEERAFIIDEDVNHVINNMLEGV